MTALQVHVITTSDFDFNIKNLHVIYSKQFAIFITLDISTYFNAWYSYITVIHAMTQCESLQRSSYKIENNWKEQNIKFEVEKMSKNS